MKYRLVASLVFILAVVGAVAAVTFAQTGPPGNGPVNFGTLFLPYLSHQPAPTPLPTPTPTATSTPVPTATGEPLPTSTPDPGPSPTPRPDTVHILPNHSYYYGEYDRLHIVGEVFNNTAQHVYLVKISVNFYDSLGRLTDTASDYVPLDDLPVGEKTCFDVEVSSPSNWARYEFEAPAYYEFGEPLPNLTFLNVSAGYNSSDAAYRIIGQVRNDEGARVEYVESVATLYDSSGTVMGCGGTLVNSRDLNPGQISSFELWFGGNHFTYVTSYRLQADGYLQD